MHGENWLKGLEAHEGFAGAQPNAATQAAVD